MRRLPQLEIVASFGVGYEHIDAKWAGEHGVVVTHTPGVLDDEVADIAMALTIMAVRQLPQAERYLRAGDGCRRRSRSPRRCAAARWAFWGSAGSARRSPAARKASGSRSSTTAAARRRTLPTPTIRR